MAKKEIVVIGGGPAGIEAAKAAIERGGRVSLVSDGPIGGRAGWHSLLPSKAWLSAASLAGQMAHAPAVGFTEAVASALPDEGQLLSWLNRTKTRWGGDQAATLEQLGVTIMQGRGQFIDTTTLRVGDSPDQLLTADAFIVATGSVPVFPPGLKPDGQRVIAPRFASALDQLPESVVVIGGGATGSEFAYLFSRLGVLTTWLIDEFGVLPGYAPELGQFLLASLTERGVRSHVGDAAEVIERHSDGIVVQTRAGQSYAAAMAFVAIGRKPDLDGLGLAEAGVTMAAGLPVANDCGQTANERIYVVGDAAGGRLVANKAMAQARLAVAHCFGETGVPYRPLETILATYTEPEIAQVGTLDGEHVAVVRLPNEDGLKSRLENETAGFVLLAYEEGSGKLLGAAAAGRHAADVLAPMAVALRLEATVETLADLYVAHPTASERLFAAARLAQARRRA